MPKPKKKTTKEVVDEFVEQLLETSKKLHTLLDNYDRDRDKVPTYYSKVRNELTNLMHVYRRMGGRT
jgi:hypothetical protein